MPILRELLRQRRALDQRIADYHQRERPAALASARALAAKYGLTPEQVFDKPAREVARFRLGCYLDPKPARVRTRTGSAPRSFDSLQRLD